MPLYFSKGDQMEEKKEERVVNKPVVKGNVKIKKEPISRKFGDVFLSDSVDNVKSYVIFDVIVPAIKNLIVDMITNGTEMLVNGRGGGSSRRRSGERENYTRFSRGNNVGRSEVVRGTPRNRYGYMDVIFDSRGDAREVLDCMYDILDKFKMVSVADYYELAHAEEYETYTDRKYGWFDLSAADIARDRDGYRILLPKTELLD